MIKYRCPHCNQKLGVPDEYAGRRVRCSKCTESSVVPRKVIPVAKAVPNVSGDVPVAAVAKAAQTAKLAPLSPVRSESAAQLSPSRPVQPAPVAEASLHEPETESQKSQSVTTMPEAPELVPEDDFSEVVEEDPNSAILRQMRSARAHKIDLKIPSGRKSGRYAGKTKDSKQQQEKGGGFSLGALIPDALRMPLAFVLAFGLVIGLIAVWVIMARAHDATMGFFAALIPLAGAVSLRIMPNRGTAVGFLAVLLGMVGIGAGKFAMAKWGMIPMLQKQSQEEVLENIQVTLSNEKLQLSPGKSAKFMLRIPGAIPCVAISYLVHQENADPHEARLLALDILHSSGASQTFTEAVNNIGANDASAETREIAMYDRLADNELYGRASALIFGWEDNDAISMARTYYPAYARLAAQAQLQNRLSGTTDLFKFAFMQTLSAMDMIWIALGIGGAFIISTID